MYVGPVDRDGTSKVGTCQVGEVMQDPLAFGFVVVVNNNFLDSGMK